MSKDVVMQDWRPEYRASREEVKVMVGGVVQELLDDPDNQRVMYIGGDTLVVAASDPDGNVVVYECTIRASNTEEDQVPSGEIVVQTKEPLLS